MPSQLSLEGRLTIPEAIREHLGVKPGDRVKFFVHLDGTVVWLPKRPMKALRPTRNRA